PDPAHSGPALWAGLPVASSNAGGRPPRERHPPPAYLVDKPIFIRPLAQDLVASLRRQCDDRGAGPRRGIALDVVEVIQGQMPSAQDACMDLGVLSERRPPLDGPAVELKDPMVGEAVGPTLGVLGIDRVAIAGT